MKKYNFISIVLVLCLLISSMGTLPVFASETESLLSYSFADGNWLDGINTHYNMSKYGDNPQFNGLHKFIVGDGTSTSGAFYDVDKDAGTITIRGNAQNTPKEIRMSMGLNENYSPTLTVGEGTVVFDYDIKEPDSAINTSACIINYNNGSGTSSWLYPISIFKSTARDKMQIYTNESMSSSTNASVSLPDEDKASAYDGWFKIRLVLSKVTENNWTLELYNRGYSETESIVKKDITNFKNIKRVSVNGISKGQSVTVKINSVKQMRGYISSLNAHNDSSVEKVEYDAEIKINKDMLGTDANPVIIAALYHGDKLIDCHTKNLDELKDGKISGIFENYETINSDPTVKIMAWDSLEGLTPLAIGLEKEAMENIPEE